MAVKASEGGRFVARHLGSGAGSAGLDVVLDKDLEPGPSIFLSDEFQGFVLTKMAGEGMIMLILEYSESEVTGIWDVEVVVLPEEAIGVSRPTGVVLREVGDEKSLT
ncbi:hypothetical protein SERLA73DRAFT_73345 [Serpula lacrymans var. lacrymans S7.3]|uniref:Uncharacterized protein n=2 Tax=Serpula lacrymans var. lacrymans TaxID=341189 RepID=F8PXX8_SERL3|nr:hypothetical protein SERLA73DRAFT_73345 [Serpula lacrymans var. lacrymans S7.3]